jgi:hypothetical protein
MDKLNMIRENVKKWMEIELIIHPENISENPVILCCSDWITMYDELENNDLLKED